MDRNRNLPSVEASRQISYSSAATFCEAKMGGKSYICPVHSVAISSTPVGSETSSAEWEVLRIDDVSFTNYHKFGSTVTVLPGFPEPQ